MKKLQVWIPLLFAIVMMVGMLIGFRLRGNIRPTGFFKTRKQTPVQEVMDLVTMKYVDPIAPDTLGENAIDGMLAHLDPHSLYIPPADLSEVNEDLQGNFEGIGVEFQIFDDTVNVMNVLAGGPSDKAGLKVGDKFIKVDDSVVAGNGITNDRIRKLLRGPGASKVTVTLLRAGEPGPPRAFAITRGTIPLPSVDVAYMINKDIGYIRINKFSETTHAEFAQALMKLQSQGLQRLILDLRGNGGGILSESIEIADDFLDGDKLIVYTVGARSPKVEYRCRREGLFEKGKLALLTDEGTASASEVLTGALQDWDRASIIGRRTFGKGLVQEQYQLSNGAALRLTIARYYTPTGRSIQKPYDKGHDDYNEEVMKRFHDGEVLHGDTASHAGPSFKTLGPQKRTVFGGGGITPDIFVGFDTSTLSKDVTTLYIDGTLSRFVYTWYVQHIPSFQNFRSPADFITGYHDEDRLWNALVTFADKDTINLRNIPAKDKTVLQHRIKALMARQIWRTEGYYEVSNAYDPVVAKALDTVNR
ncbi:MAG: S41 family peptidase [Bacteroidetes bacterium]|nr:S41 family peptidase [Bacteroidota bacterium]